MANVITRKEGCWLRFLLKTNGHNQNTVARIAGCSAVTVSQFLQGIKDSEKVRTAFCKVLGVRSVGNLLATMPQSGKGGAA